tara:strand:- start:562 stop:954 length:393 start_codon:yes stop_codon:yes gene_type:complete
MAYKKKNSEYDFPKELITVGNKYSRNDINQRLEKGRIDGFKGITEFNNCFALFVTLEKADKPKNQKYKDFFKNKKEFFWESQQPDKKINLDHQILKRWFLYLKEKKQQYYLPGLLTRRKDLQINLFTAVN